MKYFTRLTTRESIKGLLCLDIQIRNFGGELLLHLEEDYMHLKQLCIAIIGKPNVYFSHIPKEYTEIKINSLFLSKDKIVELDEPWVSLRTKCIGTSDVIKLHNTLEIYYNHWGQYLVKKQ